MDPLPPPPPHSELLLNYIICKFSHFCIFDIVSYYNLSNLYWLDAEALSINECWCRSSRSNPKVVGSNLTEVKFSLSRGDYTKCPLTRINYPEDLVYRQYCLAASGSQNILKNKVFAVCFCLLFWVLTLHWNLAKYKRWLCLFVQLTKRGIAIM